MKVWYLSHLGESKAQSSLRICTVLAEPSLFPYSQYGSRKQMKPMRSQSAEKITHIKGRLLEPAVILSNCVPFHNWNFS